MPFLEIVEDLSDRWESFVPGPDRPRRSAGEFLGALYDLFLENRGLVMTLWAADALTEEELVETGIADIDRAIARPRPSSGARAATSWASTPTTRTWPPARRWPWSPGWRRSARPSSGAPARPRDVIVEEITQATLHGFLHRGT